MKRCWVIAGLLSLSIVGCVRHARPARTIHPSTVGAVLPLSGPYQLLGENVLNGLRLALRESSVKLEVRDSRGDPAEAVKALEALALEAGVVAVVGGLAGPEATALASRADALGVPLMGLSKAPRFTEAGPYVFQIMPTLADQARAIAEYSTCQMGFRRFAILSPQTEYGTELTTAFEAAVSERGGTVVLKETYAADQTTFTVPSQKLAGRFEPEKRADYQRAAAKIRDENTDPTRRRKALERLRAALPPKVEYDALFLPDSWKTVSLIAPALAMQDLVTNACDVADLDRIRKTIGHASVKTVTLLGWSGWGSPENADGAPELLARGGKFLHCSVYTEGFFAGASRAASRLYVEGVKTLRPARSPDLLGALGYDAGRLLRQVISEGDGVSVRERLQAASGIEGVTGVMSVDSQRRVLRPPLVLKIDTSGIREQTVDAACRSPSRTRDGTTH